MFASDLPTATNKLVVVGDIHNNFTTLNNILKRYSSLLDEGYHFVFLGDLIHVGPGEDCHKVVAKVQELVESGKATCIRGNHDFTCRKGKYGNTEHEGALTDQQAEWLKTRPLFVRYGNWLFLHGGLTGSCEAAITGLIDGGHLPEKGDWTPEMVISAEASLNSKFRKKLQNCMYARYLRGEDRHLVAWGSETPEDAYWAEDYDGRFGYAVFGHNPWRDIAYFPCALGIDLGAGSLIENLDTPKHGLGFDLQAKRIGVLVLEDGVVRAVSGYCVDNDFYGGFPQFQSGLGLSSSWWLQHREEIKGKSYEAAQMLRMYYMSKEDPEDEGDELLGALLTIKYGFDLPLLLTKREEVKALLKDCVLNIQHAAGSDESPVGRLKASLIESSLEAILIAEAYGLHAEIEDEVLTNWMPQVEHIKASEGYGEDFVARIQDILSNQVFSSGVVVKFLEELL